jgi:hypothetical protein
MDTSDTIAKYKEYEPSRLGPRCATVILARKLGSSSRADDISFAELTNASGVVSMPWHYSREKPAILFGACAVITRTKIFSFASSKVSAVVLTSPVMDNDDNTSYCRLLQLDSLQKKIIFHESRRSFPMLISVLMTVRFFVNDGKAVCKASMNMNCDCGGNGPANSCDVKAKAGEWEMPLYP